MGVHPYLAGLVVGLVAFGESLAFVGLLVPGAFVMFGAGALIANGSLAFWPIALSAVAGAILGDGASYWLGFRYREHVRDLWPFAKHPGLLERGERFFFKHGGKSIVLGRFVGPVRPVIPVVAGMLGMPPLRFVLTNILSALGWAPGYLLPGMAFGASLALAGEVAGRLAALLGILLVAVWLIAWVVRLAFRFVQPHAADWGSRCLAWARGHRGANLLIGDLIDPAAPASRAVLLWIILLIAATWLFFGVIEDLVNQDPLVRANEAIYQMLQTLRTPLGDRIMIVFSELGDWPVTTATTIVALAWFVWRRARRDAAYWLTAIGFAWLVVVTLKLLLQLPRPVAAYSGANAFSFPSGHATMSVVIYGYLAVLGAHDLSTRWRWLPYAGGALLIAGIAFSRLYLGMHWLSDVAAGLGLGLAGVSVIAIARERHLKPYAAGGVLWVALAALLVSGVWHAGASAADDLQRYAVRVPTRAIAASDWLHAGWQALPAYRIDLGGEQEQPLNVQVGGSVDSLRETLVHGAWREPLPLDPRSALRWLAPGLPLAELPLIPRLHDGRAEALALTMTPEPSVPDTQLLLRLWPTSFRLEPGERPVWIGTITWLGIERLPLLRLPQTRGDFRDAEAELVKQLRALGLEAAARSAGQAEGGRTVVLVRISP